MSDLSRITTPQGDHPSLDVIIPVYNASDKLDQVLAAVIPGAGRENVIAVDAGSQDDSASVAERHAVRVIRLPERAGPAQARNEGARRSSADVLLFIDSDCAAHADCVDRVRAAFRADPDLASLTGSYDSAPPDPGFFSQYMNLRHHFVHQRARREHATFWAGCGAVRRTAFLRAGGFDAERYPRPAIEDTELATRIRRFGSTRLDPDLQVTHLKRWTLRSAVETDIFSRAVPWARLILERGELPNDLNLKMSQRFASPIALLTLLSVPLVVVAPRPTTLGVSVALVGISVALNASLLGFFARQRGPLFAAKAWLAHQIHLTYGGITFAICAVLHWAGRSPEGGAPVDGPTGDSD